METSARCGGQDFDGVRTVRSSFQLQACLGGEFRQRVAAHAPNLGTGLNLREGCQCGDSSFLQLYDLRAADAGDKEGTIGSAPLSFATRLVIAVLASRTGYGAGRANVGAAKLSKAPH